ncbi:MAG: ABC transporter permease subunit [Bacteroidetes bacterium]|nr:ABC transporter permease subunit [Bacteroidota bacterium]
MEQNSNIVIRGLKWFFAPRRRSDSPFKRMIIHIILLALCVAAVYPILRIVTISLRPGNRLLSTSLKLIPDDATFESFRIVIVKREFLLWIWNSLLITITTSLLGVTIASISAYGVSRWNFPGRKAGMIFLLATQMIPAAMLMVPIYIISIKLGLVNSWRGVVIAYAVSSVPFSIWILKGYYDTIPIELEQAAMIDGTTRLGAFYRVVLPLSTPSLAIAFLFNFTQVWNDFLIARIMLQRADYFTWPLGLQRMQGQFQTQWGEFAAAALLVSIPVMVLFQLSSKWLISGLTLGSVKG